MATPANRVPVRVARGTKANLDTAIAAEDLKEGEICYAVDENGLYVVEGGVLTKAGADLSISSIDALSDVDTTTAAPVEGQVLVWNSVDSEWQPGGVGGEIEWTLTANGTSDFIFAGPGFAGTETDPVVYVVRGQVYKFTNEMGSHPFQIQSTAGLGGTAYNDGVTNNAVSNGTLEWEVRMDAPSTLYYQCTSHADMNGTIYVLNESIRTLDGLTDVNTNERLQGISGQTYDYVNGGSFGSPVGTSSTVGNDGQGQCVLYLWEDVNGNDIREIAPPGASAGKTLYIYSWNGSEYVWASGVVILSEVYQTDRTKITINNTNFPWLWTSGSGNESGRDLKVSDIGPFDEKNILAGTGTEYVPARLSDVAWSGQYADVLNKPVLADVATSGSFADLNELSIVSVFDGTWTQAHQNTTSTLANGTNVVQNVDSFTETRWRFSANDASGNSLIPAFQALCEQVWGITFPAPGATTTGSGESFTIVQSAVGTFPHTLIEITNGSDQTFPYFDIRSPASEITTESFGTSAGTVYIPEMRAIGQPVDGGVLTYDETSGLWTGDALSGASVRTALGIGEYVDDAAAGTGGVASGAMYYNTTSSDYRLKS